MLGISICCGMGVFGVLQGGRSFFRHYRSFGHASLGNLLCGWFVICKYLGMLEQQRQLQPACLAECGMSGDNADAVCECIVSGGGRRTISMICECDRPSHTYHMNSKRVSCREVYIPYDRGGDEVES